MPQREGYENSLLFTISLCCVFTICVALLRLWIRRSAFGRDDAVVGAATVVSLGHIGSSYAAISFGLGKSWPRIQAENKLGSLNNASIAGVVLFFLALYLSKSAMVVFLTRITKTPSQLRLYHGCNVAMVILGVVSIFVATAGCPTASGYYWAFNQNHSSCPSQAARWQAITALDVITEIVLLALPVHLVWNLQMPLTKKVMIIAAFWIRLPALGISIGRNYYTLDLRRETSDAGLEGALITIWLEVELAYAIGACTLSALKSFSESFHTGFGLGFTRGKGDDEYGMSEVSGASRQPSSPEKARSPSRSHSRARRGTPRTPEHESKEASDVRVRPPRHANNVMKESALKLRPETGIATYTSVSAEPFGEAAMWQAQQSHLATAGATSSVGSDSPSEDMVIFRDLGYEVQHDRAPMLPVTETRA